VYNNALRCARLMLAKIANWVRITLNAKLYTIAAALLSVRRLGTGFKCLNT
jgi:hypothetical protein